MKTIITLVALASFIAVINCLVPDPPLSQEELNCVAMDLLERSEVITTNCNLANGGWSLQNFTGQVK